MNLTLPLIGMTKGHISQGWNSKHWAIDIVGNKTNYGYGTPLCAPEMCRVDRITGDTITVDSHENLIRGYGIHLTGIETGNKYLFWHILPIVPVNGGEIIQRGQIFAFMGNSGYVYTGGKYVPIDERLKPPYAGLHLHLEVTSNGNRVDPTDLFNYSWSPRYGYVELATAIIKTLQKKVKLLSK